MRIIAHLVSVVLLLPGIVVSVALLAIGHLSAQGNFVALVTALLELALAFFPVAHRDLAGLRRLDERIRCTRRRSAGFPPP